MRSALVFAGAMTAWIFAVGALARCVPGPMTPRADATDATWETVTVPDGWAPLLADGGPIR